MAACRRGRGSLICNLALSRGEQVNAVWLVLAAACVYSIAYRFYSLFIANKVFELDARRLTPAHRLADGLDYVHQ